MSRKFCCEVTNEIYRRLLEKTDDKGVIDSFMSFFHMHDYQSFFKGDEKAEPDLINYLEGAIESFEGEIKLLCVESFIYDFEQKMKPSLSYSGDRILYTRAMKFLEAQLEIAKEKVLHAERDELREIGRKKFEDWRYRFENEILRPYKTPESKLEYLLERKAGYEHQLGPEGTNLSEYSEPPYNQKNYPIYWEYLLSFEYIMEQIEEVKKEMESQKDALPATENPLVSDNNTPARLQFLAVILMIEALEGNPEYNKMATSRLLNFLTGKNMDNFKKMFYQDIYGNHEKEDYTWKEVEEVKELRKMFEEAGLRKVVEVIDKHLPKD